MTVLPPQAIKKMGDLSERHRPKKFEDVIGNENTIASLKTILERYKLRGDMPPSIMLKGMKGTGKSTLALIFADAFLGGIKHEVNFFELNGSNERGIDVIRDKIIPLARLCIKIVIFISEADELTEKAQAALKRVMETTNNVVFIFDLNDETKMLDPIKSRCAEFSFYPLNPDKIMERIYQVLTEEGVSYDFSDEEKSAMLQIINTSHGDMRKVYKNLEKIITADNKINAQNIIELNKSINLIADCVKAALAYDIEKAKNVVEDAYIMSGYNTDMLLDGFMDAIETITDKEIKVWAYIRLGELAHRLENTHRATVPLIAYVMELARAPHLKR